MLEKDYTKSWNKIIWKLEESHNESFLIQINPLTKSMKEQVYIKECRSEPSY
jgi:hypothetical protein